MTDETITMANGMPVSIRAWAANAEFPEWSWAILREEHHARIAAEERALLASVEAEEADYRAQDACERLAALQAAYDEGNRIGAEQVRRTDEAEERADKLEATKREDDELIGSLRRRVEDAEYWLRGAREKAVKLEANLRHWRAIARAAVNHCHDPHVFDAVVAARAAGLTWEEDPDAEE